MEPSRSKAVFHSMGVLKHILRRLGRTPRFYRDHTADDGAGRGCEYGRIQCFEQRAFEASAVSPRGCSGGCVALRWRHHGFPERHQCYSHDVFQLSRREPHFSGLSDCGPTARRALRMSAIRSSTDSASYARSPERAGRAARFGAMVFRRRYQGLARLFRSS